MSRLVRGTNAVGADEPAWVLKEILEPAPDGKSVRRVQTIVVIRGDGQPVEFRRDLGPAEAFTGDEFCIPGGVQDPVTKRLYVEHTVGELVEMAERLRSPGYERPERPAPHDLVQMYRDKPDRLRRHRKKVSTFSRLVKIQRD